MKTLLLTLITYLIFPSYFITAKPVQSPPTAEVVVATPVPTPVPTPSPSPTPKATPAVLAASSDSLMLVVNRVRAENGCKRPLVANSALNKAAQVRATQIVTNWSHDGYAKVARQYYKYNKIGETLAKDFSNDEQVVNAWLNSPTHKAVMLDCSYRHIGVGRSGSHIATYYGN